jgi:Fe-S-cluster-containing hydrogenase component 2
MRLGKTEKALTRDGKVTLRRRMIALEQVLVLDRETCCGCRDCETICPAEAVSSSGPVVEGGTVKERVRVDIDPEACVFCGQCAVICPTKSISWRENEDSTPTVISGGILPALDEGIEVRVGDCRIDCGLACHAACPAGAVEVKTVAGPEGRAEQIADVVVKRDRCYYCSKCELACPYGAISVRSARQGMVTFLPEHCPSECRACTEVCPTGAFREEDERVYLDERICIYCRACSVVCPVGEALMVRRDRIRGMPVHSQLWVEMLGRLVSPAAKLRLIQERAARKRERAFRTRID